MTFLGQPIFARKNYFCQSGFYHGKNGVSTIWHKPANTASKYQCAMVTERASNTEIEIHRVN